MAHKAKPKQEEEAGEGAPLWIISFADMMSLLMAFFVMLSTFSGFGPSEAEKLHKAVKATLSPNYGGGWHQQQSRTAVGYQTPAAGQPGKGSEKPTLQEAEGTGMMKETPAGDFRRRKIFLVESKTIFWGAGTTLSSSGREFLDTLTAFAAKMPDRLVISESGPGTESELGLRRAISVVSYLTGKGISKDRCSIAAQGMSPDRSSETQRMLEVALLSASVYQ
jgi:outer membrane protein OmpA-like peptidoglycan-associated protein